MGDKMIYINKSIDPDTGTYWEKEKTYDKPFVDEAGYLIGVKRSGVKMWTDFKLPEEFSWADKGRIRELPRYLIGGSFQELVYRNSKGHRVAIDMPIFEKIVDLSHDRALKFLKKLKKYNILKEIVFLDKTYFLINPKYGLQKRRLHPIVYKVFKEDIKELIPPSMIIEYERVINENVYIANIKIKE